MATPFGNEFKKHGTARFASAAEIAASGMFEYTPDAIYCGEAFGRTLWLKTDGGLLLVAGARTGKLRDILAQNICRGVMRDETQVIVDVKSELAEISQDQTRDDKFCIHWNPQSKFGLPEDRINPVGHLRWSSPTLVSDVKHYMAAMLPESGSGNAKYFEISAQRVGEGLALSLTEATGELTLPELYRAILALQAGGSYWAPYAAEMRASSLFEVRALAEEIKNAQTDSSGGWRGILGELVAGFACLSDPVLRRSVSPPFNFDLAELTSSTRKYQLYLMIPEDMVELWAPVMKSFLTTARTLKGRAPEAPRQTWIIDEAARFKNYCEISDLFTIGAGLGIRPWAIFQDISQMNDLGPNAQRKIMSSAAAQIYFGIRDKDSATHVSELLGEQTFSYDDPLSQGRAALDVRKLLASLLNGTALVSVIVDLWQKLFEAEHPTQERRMLRTIDEVLRMPEDALFLFTDTLHPIEATRAPYWTQRWMAGRYHPNPYHEPRDRVRVQTRFGLRYRPVLTRKVPTRFAHFPQYRERKYSYVSTRGWL